MGMDGSGKMSESSQGVSLLAVAPTMTSAPPDREIWPGSPYPLGATFGGAGTNFAVFSETATLVELCLFDDEGREERVALPEMTAFCWHGYLPGVRPGQRYGYRVHGKWAPLEGHRCHPSKLLLDPYAKAIDGPVRWNEAIFGYRFGDESMALNDDDSAPWMPRSVVTTPWFDWTGDHRPRTPWNETVIYELHVKGFTRLMEEVPEQVRGTYAGLGHPAAISYLKKLGVTAVELMPVHQFINDHHLEQRGLSNYWGYNTIGFFAPHHAYSASGTLGQQVQEFKQMVKELHAAGIEVILDVVYNHSAEGNHLGPMLSFKGFDNTSYYRLMQESPQYYMDYTGTGNTFNMRNAHVLQMIMDSLRYWASEMHVDGFRFDLAAALARGLHEVDRLSAFFDLIHQDPICREAKLIAEPWDLGEGGYQVGNFPPLWTEWNGKFRDTVRDFWRGVDQSLPEFASRITGSSDLYQSTGRRPYASINFVTAHDGFTLHDLVSYNEKHNQENGENNRDGESHNRSWNCGEEGPSCDAAIVALRDKQKRNLLVTLLLSQGVPMLLAGDELGRSQRGNNNTYAQDNELSWIDWRTTDPDLLRFTQRLIALRKEHATFRRRRFFEGRPLRGQNADIRWQRPDGTEMSDEDWRLSFAKSLGVFLDGQSVRSRGAHGERIVDDDFTILFNAHHAPLEFHLPPDVPNGVILIDTDKDTGNEGSEIGPGGRVILADRSLVVIRHAV